MLTLGIYKLRTSTQNYDWGSRRFFSDLRGEEQESAEPEAELWVGVHPKGPSEVELGDATTPLSDLIDALGDVDARVRTASAWALGAIEDPSSILALIDRLESDSDAAVRAQAAWAIGRMY